jgi:hypothetical protein
MPLDGSGTVQVVAGAGGVAQAGDAAPLRGHASVGACPADQTATHVVRSHGWCRRVAQTSRRPGGAPCALTHAARSAQAARSYSWMRGPGLIPVSWSMCDCPPALAAGTPGRRGIWRCAATRLAAGRCGTGPGASGGGYRGSAIKPSRSPRVLASVSRCGASSAATKSAWSGDRGGSPLLAASAPGGPAETSRQRRVQLSR